MISPAVGGSYHCIIGWEEKFVFCQAPVELSDVASLTALLGRNFRVVEPRCGNWSRFWDPKNGIILMFSSRNLVDCPLPGSVWLYNLIIYIIIYILYMAHIHIGCSTTSCSTWPCVARDARHRRLQ